MENKKDYLVCFKQKLTEADFTACEIETEDIKHEFTFMDMYLIAIQPKMAEKLETFAKVNYVAADSDVPAPLTKNKGKY